MAELEELCDSVAIIEQGKLVTTGRVRDIKATAVAAREAKQGDQAPTSVIEFRVLTVPDKLAILLAEQPELSNVHISGTTVQAALTGGQAAQAALLQRLCAAGVPIYHCAGRNENLEDLFMHITEGKVQ